MDHRAQQVHEDFQKSKKPSEEYSPAMAQYHEYCRLGECSDEDTCIAADIYKDPFQKEIVESLIIGEADPEDIEEIFGINRNTLAIYKELFFDMGVFRNKLDKLSYLRSYPDKEGKEMKMRALNLGPEYIFYTYGNIVPKDQEQRKLVERMFMAAAYKAMAINYNGISSTVTKNAVEHAKLTVKLFESLSKYAGDDTDDQQSLFKVLTTPNSKIVESTDFDIPDENIV